MSGQVQQCGIYPDIHQAEEQIDGHQQSNEEVAILYPDSIKDSLTDLQFDKSSPETQLKTIFVPIQASRYENANQAVQNNEAKSCLSGFCWTIMYLVLTIMMYGLAKNYYCYALTAIQPFKMRVALFFAFWNFRRDCLSIRWDAMLVISLELIFTQWKIESLQPIREIGIGNCDHTINHLFALPPVELLTNEPLLVVFLLMITLALGLISKLVHDRVENKSMVLRVFAFITTLISGFVVIILINMTEDFTGIHQLNMRGTMLGNCVIGSLLFVGIGFLYKDKNVRDLFCLLGSFAGLLFIFIQLIKTYWSTKHI